jgi:ABC-type lipoprotein release transport system permease subunit
MKKPTRSQPHMGLKNLLAYALSDLRHRWPSTALTVAAVALAAVYLYILGFDGACIYRYQRGVVAESFPNQILFAVQEMADRDRYITEQRLAAIGRIDGVRQAMPLIELNLQLDLDGKAVEVQAQGSTPADPALADGRFVWGRGLAREDGREVVLSRTLFEKCGGKVGPTLQPAVVTVQFSRTVGGRSETQRLRLRIAGLLRHQSADRIYLPLRLATLLDLWGTSKIEGIPADGGALPTSPIAYPFCHAFAPLDQVGRVEAEAESLGVTVEKVGEIEVLEAPNAVWVAVTRADRLPLRPADSDAIQEILGPRLTPLVQQMRAALLPLSRAGGPPVPVPPVEELARVDPERFATVRQLLAARGLSLRLLPPAGTTRLVQYKVRDARAADGRVGDRLVALLEMARPTFVAAQPFLSVPGQFAPALPAVPVVASGATDPVRLATPLLAGTWLRDNGGPNQVVLPRSVAREAVGGDRPDRLLGRALTVRFVRERSHGHDEVLPLTLRVIGVVDGSTAYVTLRLASDVQRWRQGQLVFNEARGQLDNPAEMALRGGYLRGVVYAHDVEAVPQVVRSLRQMGYLTEDRMAEQEGLARLGRVLIFIVGFFVLGSILNGAITVLVSTLLNVKNKTWEIGILRSHGVSTGDVVGIFLIQGLVIGLAAFVLAAGFVLAVEPWLRGIVCQAFALKPGTVLTGSPFDLELWWLSALVLSVSAGFSLLGVILPAIRACRLSPVEALRSRE